MSEKMAFLDLLIAVLREHEKELDKREQKLDMLIRRLEKVVETITAETSSVNDGKTKTS